MGRPYKTKLTYFPLDTDFFHNKHVKALRRIHGFGGILTYINLLCRIYGTNGYYYKFADFDSLCMDIAEDLTIVQVQRAANGVAASINYLVEQGILNEGLFKQNVITGKSIQEQFILSTKLHRRVVRMDVYRLVDVNAVLQKNGVSSEETPFIAEETEVNAEEQPQMKGKETKGKENFDTPIFSSFPTLAQVCAYAGEMGVTFDPRRFWAFYQARGWQVGGVPIADWRALLYSWHVKGEPAMRDDTKEYLTMAGLLSSLSDEE